MTGVRKCVALSLPNILSAGAGDRLRRMTLFQWFPTNRTVFLPHIRTCHFSYEQDSSWRGLPVPELFNILVSLGVQSRGD